MIPMPLPLLLHDATESAILYNDCINVKKDANQPRKCDCHGTYWPFEIVQQETPIVIASLIPLNIPALEIK
jgi:hypothetical protein